MLGSWIPCSAVRSLIFSPRHVLITLLARSLQENVAACLSRPSVSAGVGLIYSFDPIRVELNFGLPLAARQSDGYRRGLQVGMGLEFL